MLSCRLFWGPVYWERIFGKLRRKEPIRSEHQGKRAGVCDNGVTDLFVHPMPKPGAEFEEKKALRAVFQKWTAQVRAHYYGEK